MAVIKLNSSGQVILRGGLPSCTCCDVTLYVEQFEYPFGPTTYFTLTGTVGTGFTGTDPDGAVTLIYDPIRHGYGGWVYTSAGGERGGPTDITNPTGFYEEGYYISQVSYTPLP